MSRYYEMTLEVSRTTPITQKEFDVLCEFHETEFNPADQQLHEGKATLYGNGNLGGGEGEKEAHVRLTKEIRKLIGPCSVTTRWVCLEDLPSDDYTTDEDEEPED